MTYVLWLVTQVAHKKAEKARKSSPVFPLLPLKSTTTEVPTVRDSPSRESDSGLGRVDFF